MKRKGFTLVELLGVIVILGVISSITIVIVGNQLVKNKKKICVTQYNNILDAAKAYGAKHLFELNSDETITLADLEKEGFINLKDLKDPITKKNIKSDLNIKIIKYSNNSYKYYIIDNGEIGCTDFGGLYDENEHKNFKCKRATTLHTETCNNSGTEEPPYYCSGAGYTVGSTITYGNLGTKGTLASGDAFDCDVNGDGTYNSTNERFYYVSGLNGSDSSNIAVLVYYNNVSGGVANSTAAFAYDESNENWHGPRTAINQLPTTSQWKNVSLSNTTRAITNENGGSTTTDGTNTHNLPTNFSYAGYAARLITAQEVNKACGMTVGAKRVGELDSCNYLMENTNYSSTTLKYGYWIESPLASSVNEIWRISGTGRNVYKNYANIANNHNVRPVIEVNKSDINY